MNDSGKCSALSRHEEDADECQFDSLDPQINQENQEKKTNDFNREVFDSPTHRRNYKDYSLNIKNQQLKHPALFNLMNNNSVLSQNSQKNDSDTSRTSENLTQIFQEKKMRVPIEMITKSIQTSTIFGSQNKEQQTKSQVQMIPPSFLSRLTKLSSVNSSAPVYVIYPNYALPDLEFIQQQPGKLKPDIVLSPLDYKEQFGMARTLNVQQAQRPVMKKRPHSLNIEKLRDNEYAHVQDWQSLITLLPRDYRKLLRNIPGVNNASLMDSSQKPLFCMSPPIRRTNMSACDCAKLVQQQTPDSSSGSSTQPPSSGYRGSSTLLTDSEVNILNGGGSANDLKNLFVYQYDGLAELTNERPPTGRKGILRRNNTTGNTPPRVQSKPKRYSMFEQQANPAVTKLSPQQMQDKRRSLQEPYHPQDLENLMKMKQDDKDLNQLLTELELNRALSNKNPYYQQHQMDPEIQEIEARLRAENFLNSIPKSELKHYAEIANLMEWTNEKQQEHVFDHTRLKNEVSRAISNRKVTFNPRSPLTSPSKAQKQALNAPQSPASRKEAAQKKLDKDKQDKIQSNQFKRLQIQWEILSNAQPISSQKSHERNETKSGGSTPTGTSKLQSKIPRPVSYPATK
jgi:hypothetical protein